MYGGEIKAGTIYKHCSNPNYYDPDGLPKEIVEEWEPVYEEDEFKEGDYVYIERGDGGWLIDGQVVQLGGYYWGMYGMKHGHFSAITEEHPKGNSGLLPKLLYRKATKEEIYSYNNITIGGYSAEVRTDGSIAFGCVHLSKESLKTIEYLLSSGAKAAIIVQGTKITLQIVNRLLNKLKS